MDAAPPDDRLFRSVFEATPVPLLLIDDEQVLLKVNESATDLFGCPEDELVGRTIDEFTPSELDLETAWAEFLEDGELRRTFDIRRPDGETRTVEFTATADIASDLNLAVLREGGERTGDRVELGPRSETITRIFEASPVGTAVVGTDGEITDANGRAETVLGLERDEITDRSYDDTRWTAVDEAGTPLSSEELPVGRVLDTGEAVFDFEHGIERPDGETAWLSVNAAPIYGEDGDVDRVVTTVSDITDRREYRHLLEQQNERLEKYSAMVSHDLRSPLSVASGWLDVSMEDDTTAHLGKIEEALDRMEQLITDLRALGRYGQTVEGMVELDLGDVASEAWSTVDTAEATLEIQADLGTIEGERGRLLQSFENLFRNAVEHAGDVTVRVGPLDWGFYVEDDGPGIPETEREEVFEFGYSTVDDGTGIGLAIVEAVADAHGWKLDLVDAEPHGARFEFRTRWHPDRSRR
jgi:PAS domain S-box-containing protein